MSSGDDIEIPVQVDSRPPPLPPDHHPLLDSLPPPPPSEPPPPEEPQGPDALSELPPLDPSALADSVPPQTSSEVAPEAAPVPEPIDPVEEAFDFLASELDATEDRSRRAILFYEQGVLLDRLKSDEAGAVKSFLAAVNADGAFRPPLFELVRIFTRKKNTKNRLKLGEADIRAADTPLERASAWVSHGDLLTDVAGEPKDGLAAYKKALEADPTFRPALLGLWQRYAAKGDADRVTEIIAALAEQTTDPIRQAEMSGELARRLSARDLDVERQAEALRRASSQPGARWRWLEAFEIFAEERRRPNDLVEALEAKAAILRAVVLDSESAPAREYTGDARGEEAAKLAAHCLRRAALVRERDLSDRDGAMAELDGAAELAPEDPLLAEERMRLCEAVGRVDDAIRIGETLLEADAVAAPVMLLRLAELYGRAGDTAAATERLRRALGTGTSSLPARVLLEEQLVRSGDAAALAEQYESLSARDTGAAGVLLTRAAQIRERDLNDPAGAIATYRAAKAALADPRPALRAIVALAPVAGDWPALIEACTALMDGVVDPEEAQAILRDAWIALRYRMEDKTRAAAVIEQVSAFDEGALWHLPVAADLLRELGRHAEVADVYRRLARAVEESADVNIAYLCAAARAAERGGEVGAAAEILREVLGRDPRHPYAQVALAEILRTNERWENLAASLLRTAASATEAHEAAYHTLGAVEILRDKLNRAEDAARELLALANRFAGDPSIAFSLKRQLDAAGEHERLAAVLDAEAESLPTRDRATALLRIGEIHEMRLGRPDLATRFYERAREIDGDQLAAAMALWTLAGAARDWPSTAALLEELRTRAAGAAASWIDEELLGLYAAPLRSPQRAQEVADRLLRADANHRGALLWKSLLAESSAPGGRALALDRLAATTSDRSAAAQLCAASVQARMAAGHGTERAAADGARATLAYDAESAAGVVLLADALSPADDPLLRSEALTRRMALSTPAVRLAYELEKAEAIEEAGDDAAALPLFERVLKAQPDHHVALDGARRVTRRMGEYGRLCALCERAAQTALDPADAALSLEEAGLVYQDQLGNVERAESCYRLALDRDMRRGAAYSRLHDLLEQRGDVRALGELVERRNAVVLDAEELEPLFWEQARLLHAAGDADGALAAIENLVMLNAQHHGALALRAAIYEAQSRVPEAVDALRELAEAGPPESERRRARHHAAELLDRVGDARGALGELRKLESERLVDADSYHLMASLCVQLERWDEAVTAYRERARRTEEPALRVDALRAAGELYLRRLRDRRRAAETYRQLLEVRPDDLAALGVVLELVEDRPTQIEVLASAERALRARVDQNPLEVEALRGLTQVFAAQGNGDAQLLSGLALSALRATSAEEDAQVDAAVQAVPAIPEQPLSDVAIQKFLVHPAEASPAAPIFVAVAEALPALYRIDRETFGLQKSDRIAPNRAHPIRDRVVQLSRILGVLDPDVYVGGNVPTGVAAISGDPPAIVVGGAPGDDLTARQRFQLGRAVFHLRRGTLALLLRDDETLAALLRAAALIGKPDGMPRAEAARFDEIGRVLARTLSRKATKLLKDAASDFFAQPTDETALVRGLRHTANRAGLILCGDSREALGVCLPALSGRDLRRVAPNAVVTAIRGNEEARELLRFSVSEEYLAIRREIGIGLS